MNPQPQNEYLRVNKPSKNIRMSHSHQLNDSSNPVPQPPQLKPKPKPQPNPQDHVYITNKYNFKGLVQRLTSSEPCDRLPQNLPKHQKIIPEPINPDSMVPPSPMAVQEDPDVSLYMRSLQSLLEDSSGSNGDHFQQQFGEYHSPMVTQAHFQPQAPNQSNGDHFQQPFDEYHSHMLAQAHFQPQAPSQSNGDHLQQPYDEYHSHMLAKPHFQPQAPNQSNGDNLQQPYAEYHSHMLAQHHFQPQAPNQSMPQSNGVEPVIMPDTIPSSWFNGSLQQMQDAYSLQSTRVEYPQPLTPNNSHFRL